MDFYYTFNIIDFILRLFIVGQIILIYLNIRKIHEDFLRSITYLRFERIKSAFNYVIILSPFFLIASILEYPEFNLIYGDEVIHLIQDSMLFIFQIGVIYFFTIVNKVINFSEH